MVEASLFPTVVLAHSRSRHRMRHVADRVQAAKSRLISSKGTIIGGYALLFSTAPMIRIYRRARRWIEGTLAVVYGAVSVKLLLSRS